MTPNNHMEDTSISDAETDSATLAARYVLALKEQSEAKRQLESRRRWLLSELEIVDKAIVDNTALDPTNLTVAEVTRHVLALHSRGAPATTIVREVRTTKPDVDAKAVHAELRHARKTGTRRNYLYFPPEPKDLLVERWSSGEIEAAKIQDFIADQFELRSGCLSIALHRNQADDLSVLHEFNSDYPKWRDPVAMANMIETLAESVCGAHPNTRQFFQLCAHFAPPEGSTFLPFIRAKR